MATDLGDPAVARSPLVFPTPETLAAGLLKQYRVFESEEESAAWEGLFGSVRLGL